MLLGGRGVLVAEQLPVANIEAGLEHMRRERMAPAMKSPVVATRVCLAAVGPLCFFRLALLDCVFPSATAAV